MWNCEILKELIKKTGLTKNAAAEGIGISIASLNNYCRKGIDPPLDNIIKIADFFAVPLDLLVDRCTEEQYNEIMNDYGKHFMQLQKFTYEKQLVGRKPLLVKSNEIGYEAPYPYNIINMINSDDKNPNPINWIVREDTIIALEKGMESLNEKERKCINKYYKEGKTLYTISEEINCSAERVRQIIVSGIQKLRYPSIRNSIINGWDSIEEINEYADQMMKFLEKKSNIDIDSTLIVDPYERKHIIESKILKKYIKDALKNKYEPGINLIDKEYIYALNLSDDTFFVLKKLGIKTIGDFISYFRSYSKDDFIQIINTYYPTILSKIIRELTKYIGKDFVASLDYSIILLELPKNIEKCLLQHKYTSILSIIEAAPYELSFSVLKKMDNTYLVEKARDYIKFK